MPPPLEAPAPAPVGRIVRRGEIYWVAAPRADLDAAAGELPPLAHPHVIVQDDVLNDSRLTTTVVVAVTSNPKRAGEPGNLALEAGEAGLAKIMELVTGMPI